MANKEQGAQLTRDDLCDHVSSTFHPVTSLVKIRAQSCIIQNLIESAAVAHRAAVGVLEECYKSD